MTAPSHNRAPAKFGKGSHLYLIDGSGFIFRAYHALPPLTRKSDGLPVGAVSGFCNMLHRLLKEMRGADRPTHFAVIFDTKHKTFRHDFYPQYKAQRPPPPEDLVPQFPLVRDATRAFNVSSIEMPGFEADDLIATYAREAQTRGGKATIVSSDKDLMQLISGEAIELFDPMKLKPMGLEAVMEKFGVTPDKVIDVQALAGDSVDNVPGVPGIGVKTAAELINLYGDLETLLSRAGEIKQPKRRESLLANAELARLSKRLVTLDTQVKLDVKLDELALHEIEPQPLIAFLRAMEFNSLTRKVAAEYDITHVDDIAPAAAFAAAPRVLEDKTSDSAKDDAVSRDAGFVGRVGDAAIDPAVRAPFDVKEYACITKLADLEKFVVACRAAGIAAFDTETTGLDPMKDTLVGFSLAHAPGQACYVPLAHGADGDLMGGGKPTQIAVADALAALKPLLEDRHVLKIGHNIKFDMAVMAQLGVQIAPFDDTMLMSYVLDAGRGGHGMDALSKRHLEHTTVTFDEVTGTGKKRISFGAVELPRATEYAAEDADVTLRLFHVLKPRLAPERLTSVYEYLERPLAPVLMAMERAGVLVDRATLARLSARFAERMAVLETDIHKFAGSTFNLGSPKQLGEILFDRMSLPGGRRTATGAWSTDSDVLEELAAQGHEIPRRLMDWRQLQKLRGTYTDALPEHINAQTGRVHTSYAMASTNTGRLSSSDPNLQNIPVRTEEGRQIRTAFIAPKGKKLISADYSQIELRLLAHIADIGALKKAFAEGLDIHAMTASEMFGVPVKDMPPDVRRRAKAINFGIIYGISAFGLANQLSIPRGEAEAYIKTYFERFPGIRDYMERTKAAARKDGHVSTVFGRRIHFPEINAKVPAMRAFQERASINAPIQGSAADVIRRAMVQLPDALKAARLSAKMLLQVHDELIFEVDDAEIDETSALVRRVMENACAPLVNLDVRLTVDARAGMNWDEAH